MNNIGEIEIRVSGLSGNSEINPDNYDIRDVIDMLENVENLLYPNSKQNRPTVSYKMLQGSVRHVFMTSMQYIISFNAVIAQIEQRGSIDFLEQYEDNILYKIMGVYAIGKQHIHTGEIDTSSLKFVNLVDYKPKYDENYLSELRKKAKSTWLTPDFNAEDWINKIRGRT